jgi:hypothetical protein
VWKKGSIENVDEKQLSAHVNDRDENNNTLLILGKFDEKFN